MFLLNAIKAFKVSFLLIILLINKQSLAAEVPPGTKLAKNQVFNRGNGAEPKTLDPQKAEETSGGHIIRDLFEGLTTEDARGNIIPGQAESWTISPNGLVYTFKLRNTVRWSDGSPVTADDFVFSYRRLVDPKVASTYSFILSCVKNADLIISGRLPLSTLGIQAIDKRTLEVALKYPTPYFLDIAALPVTVPTQRQSLQKYKDKFTQPGNLISNGPYMLKSWVVGDKITLIRNAHYWNNAKTVIDTINFYPTENIPTETKMFMSGQLDWTFNILADQFKKLKEELGSMVKTAPYLSIYYYNFNLESPKFKNNLKLRKALSLAIDREIIANIVMGRGEVPSFDFVPLGTKNYEQNTYDWQSLTSQERIELAKKLYAEAGYSPQKPFEVTLSYNTNEVNKKIALSLASMWQKNLKVKVTLKNMEWKVFLTNRHKGDFEVARHTWVADYNDPSSFLSLLHSKNLQNASKYNNPVFDSLLDEAVIEQNQVKRKNIFRKVSKIAMEDYVVIPLFSHVTTHLVKPYVGGYCVTNPLDRVLTNHLYILEH